MQCDGASAYGWIMIAPRGECLRDGGQATVYGAITCETLTRNSGFDLYCDDTSKNAGTCGYVFRQFHEEVAVAHRYTHK